MKTADAPAQVGHSELGASSYKRWKACPGSVRLSRGVPNKSSSYAEEGTQAHALAETMLRAEPNASLTIDEMRAIMGAWRDAPAEMKRAVEIYLAHVEDLRQQEPAFEQIEAKLDLTQYHPKLFGTGDYLCYFAETKTLHVVDYKHGAGVAVEVIEDGQPNVQLMYYAAAALHKTKVPVAKVVVTIVQPRCPHQDGPVRSVEIDACDMIDFLADLVEAAKKTEEPDAILCPGGHCRWCPAQGFCPAIKTMAISSAQRAFSPTFSYDPAELAQTLSRLDQIEAWAAGVRKFAYAEAEAGREIPGYKLVDKRATRKWGPIADLNPEGIAAALFTDFDYLNREDVFETKLRTPAQLEKSLKTPADKKRLEYYTLKESSGKNLVPVDDDRRPAIPQVRNVFEKIEH